MKKAHRFVALAIVILMMSGSMGIIAGCQKTGATSVPILTESDKNYDWPGYTLDEAVAKADHIVYGRVVDKRGPVVYKAGPKDGMEEKRERSDIALSEVKWFQGHRRQPGC